MAFVFGQNHEASLKWKGCLKVAVLKEWSQDHSSSSVSWELLRNASPQALPKPTESAVLGGVGGSPAICALTGLQMFLMYQKV